MPALGAGHLVPKTRAACGKNENISPSFCQGCVKGTLKTGGPEASDPRLPRTEAGGGEGKALDNDEVCGSVDECVATAFDEGVARLSRIVALAGARERVCRERIRAALSALLRFLDEEPCWACFLILGPSEGARTASERRERALLVLARALERETRSHAPGSAAFIPSSRLTAELIVGGVFTVVRARVLEGTGEPLVELVPSLMSFIGVPYGSADDRGEPGAERPAPIALESVLARDERVAPRVTYRTMRVLRAIAQAPYSNNREIAQAAGLVDEGQTSKLLRVWSGRAWSRTSAWARLRANRTHGF